MNDPMDTLLREHARMRTVPQAPRPELDEVLDRAHLKRSRFVSATALVAVVAVAASSTLVLNWSAPAIPAAPSDPVVSAQTQPVAMDEAQLATSILPVLTAMSTSSPAGSTVEAVRTDLRSALDFFGTAKGEQLEDAGEPVWVVQARGDFFCVPEICPVPDGDPVPTGTYLTMVVRIAEMWPHRPSVLDLDLERQWDISQLGEVTVVYL